MLVAITQLLCCQLVGEVIARVLELSIPGPVIGMSLLLMCLYKETIPQSLESTAEGILSHLSLLFVPAEVGVVAHLTVLGKRMACDCWFFDWLNYCNCVGDWLDSSATASRPIR